MIKNFTVSPKDMSIKSINLHTSNSIIYDGKKSVYDVRPFFDSLPDFKDKLAEALIYMGCAVFPDTEIEIRFSWEGYHVSILGGEVSYKLILDQEEGAIDEVSLRFFNKETKENDEEIFYAISHLNTATDMKASLGIALHKKLNNPRFIAVPISIDLYDKLEYIYTVINMSNEFVCDELIPKKEDSNEKEERTTE